MADGNRSVEQFDLPQIAAALNRNKSSVIRRAAKEGWAFIEQAVRGGQRRLYPLALLPEDVQSALRRAESLQAANAIAVSPHYQAGAIVGRRLSINDAVEARVAQRCREQGAAAAAGLTGVSKARMDAKLDVLARLTAYAQVRRLGQCAALDEFCRAYNAGEIDVAQDVREHAGETLSPITVRRWKKLVKTQGPAALAGAYGNRKGASVLDSEPEINRFVIGLLAEKPHISSVLMHRALCTRFKGAAIPTERNVARWLANWKQENARDFMALTNPDGYKNRYLSAFGKMDEQITAANQLWMMDSTPADVMLADGRHSILGVIDVATRRLRFLVSKTSTAEAVGQLARRAILEWGVPEAVKLDNGKDYASVRFNRLLAALHIEPRFSMPFAGWEKAFIERAFRTFSHGLLELLPGYVGHNVAEAQEIRARQSFAERLFEKNKVVEIKLTASELQDFCDRWCDDVYAHTAHEGLGGITPFNKAAATRNVVKRIEDERALDLLLGEGFERTVVKKGLRIEGLHYIAPELATVIGEPVLVRMDDADLGRAVVYHNEQFLCVAECPEITGISRQEVAAHARRKQTERTQSAKKLLREASRKAGLGELVAEIMDESARQAATLAALPAPNVVHLTPALEAATEAADALEAAEKPTPATTVTLENLVDLRDAMRREQVQDETSEQRFRRALDTLMKPEDERNDIERRFLKSHCNSPEFKGRWSLFEDFGPASLGLPDTYAALLPDGAAYDRLYRAQQGEI